MKESPKMMYIGQHAAGRFSKETPSDIAGFTTNGMGPCCHVIIHDKESERCVFSHADFASDLKTDVTEWLKWVNNGKSSPSFTIHVGEDVDGTSGYLDQVMEATASFMKEAMPDYVRENFPDGITAENLKRGGILSCEQKDAIAITRNGEIRDHIRSDTIDVNNASYFRGLQEFNEKEKYERSETYPTQLVYDIDRYLPTCPLKPEKAEMLNHLYDSVRSVVPADSLNAQDIDNIAADLEKFNKDNTGKTYESVVASISGSVFQCEHSQGILREMLKDEASFALINESGFSKLGSQDLYSLMYPLNDELVDRKHTKQPYIHSSLGAADWSIDTGVVAEQAVSPKAKNPLNIYEQLALEFRDGCAKGEAAVDIRREVPARRNPLDLIDKGGVAR